MKLDPVRTLRLIALVVWAAFFDYLWLSGDSLTFVGPRTRWVVPFGAVVLTWAAVAYLPAIRGRDEARISLGDLAGTLVLVAPVLAVIAIPGASLGALAVERKAGSEDVELTARDQDAAGVREVDVYDIAYASQEPADARSVGVVPGKRVSVVGLTSDPGPDRGHYAIARFKVNCCAADAMPVLVRVAPVKRGAQPRKDTWVRVEGRLERSASYGFVIRSERFTQVGAPDDPYL